jgi:elongator complex protein 3
MRKPTKTISGVTPVAIVIKPMKCKHGTCIYCPSLNVPQSYTPRSPAIMRAMCLNYDAFKQVQARIESFKVMKHPTDKIELIILGGTFLSYPIKYQYSFILSCYNALNATTSLKSSKSQNSDYTHTGIDKCSFNNSELQSTSNIKNKTMLRQHESPNNKNLSKISLTSLKNQLAKAKKVNEKAEHRCIALCIETRPDVCTPTLIKRMLEFGCTRVELGVQALDNEIYKKIQRGHTVEDVIQATKRLKDAGFKVGYHIMPGLPYSNFKKDKEMFEEIFKNEDFKPDQLKIYPCQVIKGSALEKLYYKGKYKTYTEQELIKLIVEFKKIIPKYCRIMRIMREIPPEYMIAGTKRIDLRKLVHEEMKKQDKKCNCIRCREIGFAIRDKKLSEIDKNLRLNVIIYQASHETEYFLEIVNNHDTIFGLIRLRLLKNSKTLLVRELHVYGPALEIGKKDKFKQQHTGLGKELMEEAEKIAKKHKLKEIKVISGVGVREYYKNLGYKLKGDYMVKKI